MAKTRQGARPTSSAIEVTLSNQTLTDRKVVFDRLAAERGFLDIQTKIDIGLIYSELKRLFQVLNETVLDLIDEHSEGEDNSKKIRPGSVSERKFQRAHRELMQRGEYTITIKPIKLSKLMLKRRNDVGEREDELFELSADEIVKLGELLEIDQVD